MPFNISTSDPKYSKELHFHWVELPTDQFGPVSGGIYLQFPWDPAQAVIGCSISATWIYADVASNSISSDAAWSITNADAVDPEITMGFDASSAQARDYHRLITLKERWYRSLTPPMPSDGSKNKSHSYNTLQQLFSDVDIATDPVAQRTQPRPRWDEPTNSCIVKPPGASITDADRLNSRDCGLGGKRQAIELILASTFANGLSRYGSRRTFKLAAAAENRSNPFTWDFKQPPRAPNFAQTLLSLDPKHNAVMPASPGSNFVTQRMKCEVVGYAWYASSSSDYLAAGVLLIYTLIALTYTGTVLLFTGVTSSSRDTVTELLALALQSPVPESMSGSGAGVERFATYSRMVRLRASREEGRGRQRAPEKLVLVVGDEKIPSDAERNMGFGGRGANVRHRRIVVDKEYS